MTKFTKQQVLEDELAELNRVGKQPFPSDPQRPPSGV